MDFKDRLKYLIDNVKVDSKPVTTYRIGKETSISRVSYENYMSGKQTPTIEKAIIIAQYFNISMNWLLMGEGNIEKSSDDNLLEHLKSELREVWEENKSLNREIGKLESQLKEIKKRVLEEGNAICADASGFGLEK